MLHDFEYADLKAAQKVGRVSKFEEINQMEPSA